MENNINRLTHRIIGAAIEVHRQLGAGFAESVYESAFAIELQLQEIIVIRQHAIDVLYKGQLVGRGRLDLLIEDLVIVELKAVEQVLPVHQAQVLSYLRATNYPCGLLINFNVTVLSKGVQRFASPHRT